MSQHIVEKALDKHAQRLKPIPVGLLSTLQVEGTSADADARRGRIVRTANIARLALLFDMIDTIGADNAHTKSTRCIKRHPLVLSTNTHRQLVRITCEHARVLRVVHHGTSLCVQ